MQLYFINGFTNIFLKSVNCVWLVDVTLIFDGTPQKIAQRCQIEAPRWPNDVNSAANNAIFPVETKSCRSPLTVTAFSCSFSKKNGPIMPLDQNPHQTETRFVCVGFSMYACGFSVLQMRPVCLFTYLSRSKWASSEKMIFLIMIFKVRSQYFPALFCWIKLIICQIRHELSVTIYEISTRWKKS